MSASGAWAVAKSSNFEVYSEAGAERARAALAWFENLKFFFDQSAVLKGSAHLKERRLIRVIGFSSQREYNLYRLRVTADAYYLGAEDGDYIVMPALEPEKFGVAAHEYAHSVLHTSGLHLPAWLEEGLAEVFSTVRITSRSCELGGALPMRMDTLRRHAWVPLDTLFAAKPDSVLRQTREGTAIFYAESWALTDMLMSSPEYAAHSNKLIAALNEGLPTSQAFMKVYGRSLAAVFGNIRDWVRQGMSQRRMLLGTLPGKFEVTVTELSSFQSGMLMAELVLASGEWYRAQARYLDLLRQSPDNPDILASLGTVALRKGDVRGAAEWWHKAMDHGEQDPNLYYRYAVLADGSGLPEAEIKRALERAVALKPDFSDARYRLALLESNAGEFEQAAAQLKQMPNPAPGRAFGYWSTLAYALSELGQREEAQNAAREAMKYAASDADRAHASQLAYIARTDLHVQFARDPNGNLQLVTTRAPHETSDWNPFIEQGDRILHAEGSLRGVQCEGGRLTGFLVETPKESLTLSVPDPTHVLMRNSPSEFNCGPQKGRHVRIDYAVGAGRGGVLRGMEFQ
jgi:tetratricopeptide (TPR) repeat protein